MQETKCTYTSVFARIISKFRRKLKLLNLLDCMRTKPFMILIDFNTSKSASVNSVEFLLKKNLIQTFPLEKAIFKLVFITSFC